MSAHQPVTRTPLTCCGATIALPPQPKTSPPPLLLLPRATLRDPCYCTVAPRQMRCHPLGRIVALLLPPRRRHRYHHRVHSHYSPYREQPNFCLTYLEEAPSKTAETEMRCCLSILPAAAAGTDRHCIALGYHGHHRCCWVDIGIQMLLAAVSGGWPSLNVVFVFLMWLLTRHPRRRASCADLAADRLSEGLRAAWY